MSTASGSIIAAEREPHGVPGESEPSSMPTLLDVEGFRFWFFSQERNEPPHVHVEKGDGRAKFWLSPVELAYARGFTKPEIRRSRELVNEHAQDFLARWRQHFSQ